MAKGTIKRSLTKRILFYFLLVSTTLIVAIFFAFEEAGKVAFKNMEREKAQVVMKAITPSIAMNLYLGFTHKIQQILDDILKRQRSILGITVVSNGRVIASKIKGSTKEKDYFILTEPIYKPNSKEIIGRMHVIYSYEHYNELIAKYEKLLLIFLAGIAILLFLFSVYLDQLLAPLQRIALKLNNYSHKKPLRFEFAKREDEIGAISRALEQMQNKILDYNKRQELYHKMLEQEVQEKTRELRERLYIDPLTGLANRTKLQEDLERLQEVTLVIINIDDFKEINDLFGHKSGDQILKTFAAKLQGLFSTNYPKIYRLSGDEFALLFNRTMEPPDVERFLQLLMEQIDRMVFLSGDKEFSLRTTIGVSLTKEGALEKADIALKKARELGKPFEIYNIDDRKVEEQYKRNIEWIKRLKKAIELDRIVPYFQPIVNLQTLQPKGYEALIRLIDEQGYPVAPGEFLAIAKKSRLYSHLTKIMIEKSCAYFQESPCSFSLNLSIEDILNPELTRYLETSIRRYGVSQRIVLEVVESEGIDNYAIVSDFLFRMKELGCQIAIDDFGSGYSNFEHILNLPLDYIKIDGSLVRNIEEDYNSQIIVSAIVELAKKKGIKTISEFVSSQAIFERVRALGVDYGQGFYFAKPQPFVDESCGS
ncbi:MAG: diguanylate cyclase [Nitratiruptor sp.]|nr:diguanylate cyclase [Nitratiruptor sp.]NPA83881.1 EAL domain-containing protein [Campylobacterota bacterium]